VGTGAVQAAFISTRLFLIGYTSSCHRADVEWNEKWNGMEWRRGTACRLRSDEVRQARTSDTPSWGSTVLSQVYTALEPGRGDIK